MKKITLTFVIVCYLAGQFVQAQQTSSSPSYDRISLSVVYVDDPAPDEHMNQSIRNSASTLYTKGIKIPDRYDDHALPTRVISYDLSNVNYVMPDSTRLIPTIDQAALGRQMVEKWFSRNAEGMFNMDLIKQRGLYNATDNDYLTQVASERRTAALEDMGEKLIQKSYLLLINHCGIEPLKDSNNKIYYKGSARAYLYKLVWDEEAGAVFYGNLWINDNDDAATRKQKIDQFNNTQYKFKYVKSFRIDKTQTLTTDVEKMSDQQKIDHLNGQLAEGIIDKLAGTTSEFTVKKHLIASDPPAATIGAKEGLYVDQRFFVYETVMGRNQVATNKRRSVLRVKKVSDNRKVTEGKTTPSVFYHVAAGKIDHYGMFIEEKNDYGVSLSMHKVSGGIGGVDFMATYRISRFVNSPGLQIYGDLGFDSGYYPDVSFDNYYKEDFNFTRFSVGILKEYHFWKIFQATWKGGYGMESTELTGNKESTDQADLSGQFILLGGRLGLNVVHNVQLVSGVNLYMPFGNASLKVGENEAVEQDNGWTDFFEDRKGLNLYFGLKYLF